METLSPAYGRDYSSRQEVLAALKANKDFVRESAGMFGSPPGTYCNLEDLADEPDSTQLRVRFRKKRQVVVVSLGELRAP